MYLTNIKFYTLIGATLCSTFTNSQTSYQVESMKGVKQNGELQKDSCKIRNKKGETINGIIFNNCTSDTAWKYHIYNGLRNGPFFIYYCNINSQANSNIHFYNFITESPIYRQERSPFILNRSMFLNNNKIKERGFYNNNKLEGEYVIFNRDGEPTEIHQYNNGKLNGRSYFLSRDVLAYTDYESGRRIGPKIEYNLNGSIVRETYFSKSNIPEQTITYEYTVTGVLREKIIRQNGKSLEKVELFREDGVQEIKTRLNGKFIGPTREYYSNSNLKLEYTLTESNTGKSALNGPYNEYFENGNLSVKSNYSNGKLNGLSIKFFENGKMESKTQYVNGLINGPSTYYYESGKIRATLNYSNNLINGISYAYFENGKLMEKANFKNGELEGAYYNYNIHGQIIRKRYYKKGEMIE